MEMSIWPGPTLLMADQPLLQMEGRSGCRLELIKGTGGRYLVKKYAGHPGYNHRLLLQYEKQARFSADNAFHAPSLYDKGLDIDTGLAWFTMDYIHGEKYSDYLSGIGKPELQRLTTMFLAYFDNLESRSRMTPPPVEAIHQKIATWYASLEGRRDLDLALIHKIKGFLETQIPMTKIPLGPCHGDFTLSNMLFDLRERIFLLDFLDSFIESPLIDLVKLRQDSCYYWSLLIEADCPGYKANRVMQAAAYLDHHLAQYIAARPAFAIWYPYLEVFNLARILPYVSQPAEVRFLENHLETLINV